MGATFSRQPIESNTWHPEVLGIDYTERMLKALGEAAAQGNDTWCTFVTIDDDDLGEGYTEQVTQDNCMIVSSDLDDDSDAILLLDKRDQKYFRFSRFNHQESFNDNARLVVPWAKRFGSMVPLDVNLKPVMDQLQGDIDTDRLTIPDDWQ